MRDAVLMIITLVCSFVALRQPFIGLLAFVSYGLMAPHTLTWDIARAFPHSMLIALCTILGFASSSEKKKFPVAREVVILLLLWGLFGISTLFAIEPDSAMVKFIWFSKILLMVFLSMAIINDEKRIHFVLRAVALSLGFYALKGAFFFLRTGGEGMVEAPEGSFLSANNSLGAALVINLPIVFYLLMLETNPWFRWLLKLIIGATYIAILGTFSRGAWVALGAVTAYMWLKTERKLIVVAVGALMLMIAAAFLPDVSTVSSERLSSRVKTFENIQEENSAQQRFWNWEFCKRVGLEHPFTGGGFDYYSLDAYARYYPEFLVKWPGKVWSCHSSWLTIWGEHGIPAFGLWVLLIVSCFVSTRWIRSQIRQHSELKWFRPLPSLLEASFIGFAVAGSFVDFAYFDLFYQLIALMVVTKDLIARKVESISEMEIREPDLKREIGSPEGGVLDSAEARMLGS
jgi:probable O-glycosylation ligase (exosortase A-associated)